MIFTISLVVTGLYSILGKVVLKTLNKYPSKVLVFSLGLQFLRMLLIIKSGTDRKYLLKELEILFKLDGRLVKLFGMGKVSYCDFLPVKVLTIFQELLILSLEFIICLS
jgi:hypothetical protein